MIQHLLCGAGAAKHAGNGRENGIGWAVRAASHAAPYAEDGQGTMHEGETNDPLVPHCVSLHVFCFTCAMVYLCPLKST